MLVTSNGETAGALSAGCIEEEVAKHAGDVIASGKPKLVSFDTRRRFGCSGSIEIFIERLDDGVILALKEKIAARQTCNIITVFEGSGPLGSSIAEFSPSIHAFVQRIEPAIRLLIFGEGTDADALAAQAQLLGWEVYVLPSITELRVGIDHRTAVVIATHNFGRDCAALRQLLPLGLRYVGLMGPRRRREELLIDVLDTGATLTSELFAPAGLDLGAEMPEEIALSIVAEIQRVFASASGEYLRDRKAPIHQENSVTWEELPA